MVGKKNFLGKSESEVGRSDAEIVNPLLFLRAGELSEHFRVVDDRTCDQLRKEGYKQPILSEIVVGCFRSVMQINQEGNLLESEKRNANRKAEVMEWWIIARSDCVQYIHTKVGVFEVSQNAEIADYGEGGLDKGYSGVRFIGYYAQETVIAYDRSQ